MPRFTERKNGDLAAEFRIELTLWQSDWDLIRRLARVQGITPREWLVRHAYNGIYKAIEDPAALDDLKETESLHG